jgi:hypothetical protein
MGAEKFRKKTAYADLELADIASVLPPTATLQVRARIDHPGGLANVLQATLRPDFASRGSPCGHRQPVEVCTAIYEL